MKNVMRAVSFGIGAMSLAVGMAEDAAMVVARRAADEQARGAGKRGWIAWEAERNQYFPTQNLARVREIASFLSSCATPAGVPANHRAEAATLRIRPTILGEFQEASEAPESVRNDGSREARGALNPSQILSWTFELAPGETKELTYRYTTLVRF